MARHGGRAARSGAARPSVLTGASGLRCGTTVALPSTQGAAVHPPLLRPGEGGRPPVPRGTGAGPSLPGLRCRAVVVPSSLRTRNHHAATVAGARHVPVGRTVLVESVCRQGGTHSGTVPTGRGSKGVAPQRGWHSSQRPHLRKVGHGSTRNFLANTRAPPSLRRARCGRTSTFVIVPRRAA